MAWRPGYVSVIDPVAPAIERVKTVLFRPFDLGRWFVIGLCAWLAQLGQQGGGGGGSGGPPGGGNLPAQIEQGAGQAREFVNANLHWLIPVAVLGVLLFVALALLVIWLSSRGRFMFLYCVAQNRAEVVNPWRQFRRQANSLFAFRVVLGIVAFVLVGGFALVAVLAGVAAHAEGQLTPLAIVGIAGGAMFAAAIMILVGVAGKFTKDFVVPIMYLRTIGVLDAWTALLDVISSNKARFFLYLLFQIAIGLAIGSMLAVAACATCFCACCLFAIPYVGTVLLLPVHVFTRSYSLYYLAQYGPEFNAIVPEPQTTPGPAYHEQL